MVRALQSLKTGALEITLPGGERLCCAGESPGAQADIIFRNSESLSRIAMRSDIGFGEGYMLGLWDTSDLKSLLQLMADNYDVFIKGVRGASLYQRIYFLRHAVRANTRPGSRRNIRAHYDLSNDFYRLWLDNTMTYSGALFNGDKNMSLEQAQQAKYRRIIDKLSAGPGSHILELGCGWGGFMAEAAKKGIPVTGITISKEQAKFAARRLQKFRREGLSEIRLQDYRDVGGQFDHVVSIGMMEHVGEVFWPAYMAKIYECLKPRGSAVIQSIVVRDELFDDYRNGSDFIREYIFPGGLLPSVFRLKTEALGAGLEVKEVFHFGSDYALTLEAWLQRFDGRLAGIKAMGYDDKFIRKWRFYLAACAAMFRSGRISLVQVELRKA